MYEFSCQKCGHHFEDLVTLAELDAGDVACPSCGSEQVVREMSTFATGGNTGGGVSSSGCGSGGFT